MYVVCDTYTNLLHFAETYPTIEDAACEVCKHVSESPYEYDTEESLYIARLEQGIHPAKNIVARITIKQNAWLHNTSRRHRISLILPKKSFRKNLPHTHGVVIWNDAKQNPHHPTIYKSYEEAANTLGNEAAVLSTDETFKLIEFEKIADIQKKSGNAIPISECLFYITIEKRVWLTYCTDVQQHRILLPLSKRTIRKLRKKYRNRN